MTRISQLYRTLNLLSIDVAAGSIVSALLFARVLDTGIKPYPIACLGLTVWIIYTADHLADVRLLTGRASTERHRFHQDHFKLLTLMVVAAIFTVMVLVFFIRPAIFRWGLYLSAAIVVYFLVQSRLKLFKEPVGALLYGAGILLPSLPLAEKALPLFTQLFILQFVTTALINLILFSWFDHERDLKDKRDSLVTSVGHRSGKAILIALFVLQAVITCIMLGTTPSVPLVAIPIAMNITLLVIFCAPEWFASHDRYRYAGDAIFFLPLIYLAGTS